MKMRFLILGALCAVMVGACNGNDSAAPGGKAAGTDATINNSGMKSMGACQEDQEHQCTEVAYSANSAPGQDAGQAQAKYKKNCEQRHNTYLSACTGGSLGGCLGTHEEGQVKMAVTVYFYAGSHAESTERVKQFCTDLNETFVTN